MSQSESVPVSMSQNDESVANFDGTSKQSRKCKVSGVWSWFEKIHVEVGGKMVERAKCPACSKVLTCGSGNGTSHLKKHMDIHANSEVQNMTFKNQMQLGKDESGNLSNFKWDKEVARKETVDFIIRAELPFSFVDSNDFNGWIQRAFIPQYSGFSSQTCKRDVMKRFVEKKADLIKLFDNFDGKVSLTSDMWTSRQKLGYMSLTAHFIDRDWIMHKRILSFKMIAYPHSGEVLADQILEELISWKLHEKVFGITLDNASNNDVLVNNLVDSMLLPSISSQLFHSRCTCHILNLIVQDGLSVLSPSVQKITDIVKSMNSTPKRHEIYVNACKELGLSKKNIDNDVPHRWNSTFDLLSVALKYRTALTRYANKMNENRHTMIDVPNEHDWYVAALLCNFLSIFNSSTKMASGVYTPTSNRVITCLVDINVAFTRYDHIEAFSDALRKMRLKFNKYWAEFPIVWCLATVMDPRYKLAAIDEFLKCYGLSPVDVQIRIDSVKITLHVVYDMYKRKFARDLSASLPFTSASASASVQSVQSDILEPIASASDVLPGFDIPVLENYSADRWKRARVCSGSSSTDLQMYLELRTIEDNSSFDILSWWKANQSSYPVLSLMARDLLTVPASTVASEAAFSAGGRIVSDRRASLSPKTLEALVCCKDWALAATRMQEQAAIDEANEMLNEAASCRPEWLLDAETFESVDEPIIGSGASLS